MRQSGVGLVAFTKREKSDSPSLADSGHMNLGTGQGVQGLEGLAVGTHAQVGFGQPDFRGRIFGVIL
jgi:hypothetical protein